MDSATKVCMVCSYSYPYSDKAVSSYAVMIVEVQLEVGGDVSDESSGIPVNDKSLIAIRPKFLINRISLDGNYTFCVLNSTLYMIEMGIPTIEGSLLGKSIYTCCLSPYLKDGGGVAGGEIPILGKDVLLALPEMLYPKFLPFVTPTPDGKRIVVFSSTMSIFIGGARYPENSVGEEIDEEIDFEVFDPEKKEWQKLPSLRDCLPWPRWRHFLEFEIQGFTFLTSSEMLVQTSEGIFIIDIYKPENGWHGQIQLCLDAYGAYDISPRAKTEYKEALFDSSRASWFPTSSFAWDVDVRYELLCSFKTDVVYYKNPGALLVVNLQSALEMYTHKAYMLLDVSVYELKEYKEVVYRKKKKKNKKKEVVEGEGPEKKKCLNLNASFVKSLKFKLDTEACWSFMPHSLSVIRS
ncbi:Unknown protein [Striga hermonthica]|uniref:Uncharacterized protein n=1 Tax=Striga hermonthica TaxID=68872 RepID=A0A9N7N3S8_STRHE|nr:Unknown protein [Striga hermonthica]